MAFKSFSQFQEDKNGDFFVLPNDGDSADVVFLYRSAADVLVADAHYISSPGYKGYVHCTGTPSCPACNYQSPNSKYRGLRLDHKIFIPLYNITKNKIEFWDRTTFFEQTLQKAVFAPFPNPSEAVFKITRRGEAGSRDTKYDIQPIGRNSAMPYEKILADFHITLPDGYSAVIREMTEAEMSAALSSANAGVDLEDYGYTPIPRGEAIEATPTVATPVYNMPPESVPQADMPEYVPDQPATAAPNELPFAPESNSEASPADDSCDLDDVDF